MKMNFKIKSFILIFLLLVIGMGVISASEVNDDNITLSENISSVPNDDSYHGDVLSVDLDDFQKENEENYQNDELKSSDFQEVLEDAGSDVIVVENWDELQYYCSLKDDDYVLKLKENTSFYPTDPTDSNYQIKVYNKVKIIGSEGSYIGYNSSKAPSIKYTAIVVPDNYKSSISMENVTFKWISVSYDTDGVFLRMGGTRNNVFKNCQFSYVSTNRGHSCIVYLKKGTATLDSCSFINCTTDYGCVSVYDPNSVKTNDMIVRNCYFEGNYARTEPGCINNCGKLTVYNTTFFKNRSFWWAGAIHTHNGGNTTIYDSNFTDNVAGWNGGALYTYSYLQIYNTVFVGNNCTTNSGGGAIGACAYLSEPHIYIENCLFERNENLCWAADELSSSDGVGGAISIMDEGSIIVLNTTFIANSAAHGTAISANAAGEYGSPSVMIKNNKFINHTRVGDVLYVNLVGFEAIIEDNYFYGNSVEFSSLTLRKISESKDQAVLEVSAILKNPIYYDSDILDKTLYDVYINGEYVKTVDSNIFTVDFDELNMFDVYVIPTISNQKSSSITVASVGSFIYVSKSIGNDTNNGTLRECPVYTLSKALEILPVNGSILILDGIYDEEDFQINQDLTIIGSGNATLTGNTSFTVNSNKFTLKNIRITNLTADTFIKQNNGELIISNCIFTENNDSKLIDADNITIAKSIFTNNGIVVYNSKFVNIKNSVLLNNTNLIDDDNYVFDYNWWGNTLDNVSKPNDLNINNWLVLNATCDHNVLEYNQSSQVQFNCYLVENNKISKYNDLTKFDLEITTVNATVNKNSLNYNSNLIYTQAANGESSLTASYNGISFSLYFDFVKSSPNLSIKAPDIMYGQKLEITIIAPDDIADSDGKYKVSVGGNSLSKRTVFNTFSFDNLKAGEYEITLVFSGNVKYSNQTVTSKVNVNRYDSATKITTGNVEVGSDLTITITTTQTTTGNITFSINNNTETLVLSNNQATYTIKNITRGDYLIKAVYNGNDKYAVSQDSVFLEVDNLEPSMTVIPHNSTYGEASLIEVILNDDAAGFVTATMEGISNTSEVINGRAMVYISGVDVGSNRKVSVFYSGDNTYFNRTASSNVSISKGNFTFAMNSQDIHIGSDEVITIIVPAKTKGTFTIDGVVLNIPMSGEVSYTLKDLDVGNYTVTAVFEGYNYNKCVNSTSFEVKEFDSPQWSNGGADTLNTQKSSYESNCTGGVLWISQVDEDIISNIVIDCDGNIYLTTIYNVYSYDCEGNLRWVYESDGRSGNFSGLAVGRDVIISPRAGDTIYFLNQSSGEKYGYSNVYQAASSFLPVIDVNANVYTVSGYQVDSSTYNLVITPYRLWANGGDPILLSLGSTKPITAPVVNEDIFVVLGQNSLMIFDAKEYSLNTIKTGNFKNVRPVIGDGNIVYSILDDSIIAFSLDGVQFGKIVPITDGAGDNLLVDNDLGIVYATNSKGNLYKYDLITGEESLLFGLNITSGILIDSNNNLYFGCDNLFYKIDSEGNVLWKSDLASKITGTPVMNRDGIIYVTSKDNRLFALSDVSLSDPSLEVTVKDIGEGEDAIITIKINNQTTGNVSFTLNGVDYSFETGNGTIVKVIPNLPAGTYNVNVTFSGDLRFNKTSQAVTFTVKAVTSPSIAISGSVVNINLASDATGTLTVKVNGQTYTKTLVNGKATITLPDGSYDAVITYSGDSKYVGFTMTKHVSVKNPVVVPTKKASKIVAKKKTFKRKNKTKKYTVTLKSGKSPIRKVTLTLKIGKKTFKAKTNNKGKATFKIKLKKKGKYTAKITFRGNAHYKATSKKVKIVLR